MMNAGKVWLVGAGPYDEGLMTLKGADVLKKADVVVYDSLVGTGILQMMPEHAKKIDVGKKAGNHKVVQEEINRILLEEAEKGGRIVRLKGGDPFLFGRGGEELELLQENGIPFEVVPGVTSAIAVAAYAGIPVTHRDFTSSLHIITAHKKKGSSEPVDFRSLAALGDATLVFLMGIGELENICSGLMEAGMPPETPAAVLEKGTSPRQRRVVADLLTLPEKARLAAAGTPGIIIVGKVCSLAEKFHWAEDRILGGARVIITRPKAKNSELAERLCELGAEVIKLPAIQTAPVDFGDAWEMAEKRIGDYDWIVFTSDAAVDSFFSHLSRIRQDIRTLGGIRFAAIGNATRKAVESHGVLVEYMPESYNGKALGEGLSGLVQKGRRVLAFAPKGTRSDAIGVLEEKGIPCDIIEAYETLYVKGEGIEPEPDDLVVFTSASTVRGFAMAMEGRDIAGMKAVCIGEQTGREAEAHGMEIAVSKEATIDSLVEKVIEVNLHGF